MVSHCIASTGHLLPPAPPPVAFNEVHLLRLHLRSAHGLLQSAMVLDAAEEERARRLLRPHDRLRFAAARTFLRLVLGLYLDEPPHRIRFTTNPFGKPRLAAPASTLSFNMSHAGDIVLLALARGRELGVDVEEERPIEALDIARVLFSPAEHAALVALPEEERRGAFFHCWTRKEAFVKALGLGLSFPLDSFEVAVFEAAGERILRTYPPHLGCWTVTSCPIDPGYAAAVAAERDDWHLVSPQTRDTPIAFAERLTTFPNR